MNLVNLEMVVKGYGLLLDGVSAGVAEGERIGVVGRNGAGKSTLLALLAGEEQPDGGRVTRARDLRIGHLSQQDRLAGMVGYLVTGALVQHRTHPPSHRRPHPRRRKELHYRFRATLDRAG